MLKSIRNWIDKFRFGDAIVVVSGLPRSGTSMIMAMLEAAGMPVVTDGIRVADEDNPKGYLELERIKRLGADPDKSWLHEARGKAIKVISHLLKELPGDNRYWVILSKRELTEVIRSQNKMLDRRNEENPVSDAKAIDLYAKHIIGIQVFAKRARNFELLTVDYKDVIDNPLQSAKRISNFLGGKLDPVSMTKVVDRNLYRNRHSSSHEIADDG